MQYTKSYTIMVLDFSYLKKDLGPFTIGSYLLFSLVGYIKKPSIESKLSFL
jgi:hypothetical protein